MNIQSQLKVTFFDRVTLLNQREVVFIHLVFGVAAVILGLDYFFDVSNTMSGFSIENYAPRWAWGMSFFVPGFLVIFGVALSLDRLLVVVHTILCGLYFGLGVGVVSTTFADGFWGFRGTIGLLIIYTVMHAVFANASARSWRFGEVARRYLTEKD